ncbi:hypothetical protein SY28_12765 [Meiothermus taiwanensis]|nr:hypothetical protein SY28_12765 [Meiothermus taiwanensis]KZK14681.1 hypothetical protein A3962_13045 [Meiothermus taiwanensis]
MQGTLRGGKGEAALLFLSALIQGLGLSLGSTVVTTRKAKATEGWLVWMSDLGVDWLITGDAEVMARPWPSRWCKRGYLFAVKSNQAP